MNPEYRFFYNETGEYALMVFPEEQLLNVFTDNVGESYDEAMRSIREDMETRGISQATISIDLSR